MRRSKLYKKQVEVAGFDAQKRYSVSEAIALLKGMPGVKFDQTAEVAFKLGVDPRKSDQAVRGAVVMPEGTGKTVRVAVFTQGAKAEEALAAGADDEHCVAGFHQLGCLGGSAGNVKSAQGQVLGHVVGYLGVDAALKQNGFAVNVHLVDFRTYLFDFVDAQRSQRQRHQSSDFVALFEVDFALQSVADFLYRAKKHTARTGLRCLPCFATMSSMISAIFSLSPPACSSI